MRLRSFTAAWIWMAAGGLLAHAAQEDFTYASRKAPEAIVTATRQSAFTIPFRVDPPQSPEQQPVEVQLHVSTDQGAHWALSSRVKPGAGSFTFRAPHDGDYWYSIRTVDAQGVARPEGPLEPQLKVTVDTVAPRLDVTVVRGPAGEVVARWKAVDPNLKQDSFKLEYQATSAGPWEKVAVDTPPSAMRHTLSGEATWWPSATTGTILVRAEITDRAGNPAVTQAVVKPNGVPPGAPVAQAPAAPPPASPVNNDGWTANEASHSPAGPAQWPANPSAGDSPAGGAQGGTNYSSAAPPGFAPDTRTPAQQVSQSMGGRPGSPLDFSVLPAAVRPRMVASANFELEYEIESVGPSGVGKVELWGTRDGGRTWSDYAVDSDNRSPIAVKVDGEGIYGFRILVQSGSGYGGRPPAEGDFPDIWVGVDLTKPTCKITSADVTPDATELAVRWEANDDVLGPRPISLLFAENAGGPWTPIASGLENTGTYRWRLDNRVPPQIVLRLEARDEAGNIGVYDTAEPIGLDRHRPEGRIRGVRPIIH